MPILSIDLVDITIVSVGGGFALIRALFAPDLWWEWRAKPLPSAWTWLKEPGSLEIWAGRMHLCICPGRDTK